jgi:hypothetical protein
LSINASISIEIKLLEAFLHFIIFLQLMEVHHGAHTTHELLSILVVIQRKEGWQLFNQIFVEMCLQILD